MQLKLTCTKLADAVATHIRHCFCLIFTTCDGDWQSSHFH